MNGDSRKSNSDTITVGGQNPILDNSIDRDQVT